MLLLDSVYINNGGGKVLLDYFVGELEQNDVEVYYLFDKRCEKSFSYIDKTKREFLNPSMLDRFLFYKKNGQKFKKILCFANLPPNTRNSAQTFTYFHQLLFLDTPKNLGGKDRLILKLKTIVFNFLKTNSDFFLVQSENIQKGLMSKYQINQEEIIIHPFFPPFPIKMVPAKEKNTFIYVSSGSPHKNHFRLIQAFCSFFDKNRKGKLLLTIGENFTALIQLIQKKSSQGYPIFNLGFIERQHLAEAYGKSEFLIYPSLAESFGLGIIEAAEMGCKVIGADLPYIYQVCRPSLIFNPESVVSIEKAFITAITQPLEPTVLLVQNEITKIIDLIVPD